MQVLNQSLKQNKIYSLLLITALHYLRFVVLRFLVKYNKLRTNCKHIKLQTSLNIISALGGAAASAVV